MATITIPKEARKAERLVAIPKAAYDRMKKMMREMADTDESIRVFKKENGGGRLKSASNFAAILRSAERHARKTN